MSLTCSIVLQNMKGSASSVCPQIKFTYGEIKKNKTCLERKLRVSLKDLPSESVHFIQKSTSFACFTVSNSRSRCVFWKNIMMNYVTITAVYTSHTASDGGSFLVHISSSFDFQPLLRSQLDKKMHVFIRCKSIIYFHCDVLMCLLICLIWDLYLSFKDRDLLA